MIPIKLITTILGLNKRLESAMSSDKEEIKSTESLAEDAKKVSKDLENVEDRAGYSEDSEEGEKEEGSPLEDTGSLVVTKPIKGAGVDSFVGLSLESIKFWYDAVVSIKNLTKPEEVESKEDEVPRGETSSVIQPLIPEEGLSGDYEEDTSEVSEEDASDLLEEDDLEGTSKDSGISPFWFIAGISLVGLYFGVKLIYKDGKPSLALTDESRYNDLMALFLQGKYLETPSTSMSSDIIDRLGLSGSRLSTGYGVRDVLHLKGHTGIDLAAPEGTPIKSPVSGVVQYVGMGSQTAGNFVEIVGANGLGYRFLHMKDVFVKIGDKVTLGEVIGTVGSTGRSTGAHLHLETKASLPDKLPVGTSIYKIGVNVNPLYDTFYADPGAMVAEGRVMDPREVSDPVPINVQYNSESLIGVRGFNYLSVSGRDAWEGKYSSVKTSAGVFPTFSAPSYGLRAGIMNLLNYQLRYDVSDTGGVSVKVADIATNSTGYSYLHSDNGDDADRWLSTVEEVSGLRREDSIDMRDVDSLSRLVRGIAAAEHSVYIPKEDVSRVIRHYNIIDTVLSNVQK